jgi:hypothetical protein
MFNVFANLPNRTERFYFVKEDKEYFFMDEKNVLKSLYFFFFVQDLYSKKKPITLA